jgi:hypothetical protein
MDNFFSFINIPTGPKNINHGFKSHPGNFPTTPQFLAGNAFSARPNILPLSLGAFLKQLEFI